MNAEHLLLSCRATKIDFPLTLIYGNANLQIVNKNYTSREKKTQKTLNERASTRVSEKDTRNAAPNRVLVLVHDA